MVPRRVTPQSPVKLEHKRDEAGYADARRRTQEYLDMLNKILKDK